MANCGSGSLKWLVLCPKGGLRAAGKEKMKEFEVIIRNEILGDSSETMSLEQIKQFNICAYILAVRAERDGQEHTMGMWTVRPL